MVWYLKEFDMFSQKTVWKYFCISKRMKQNDRYYLHPFSVGNTMTGIARTTKIYSRQRWFSKIFNFTLILKLWSIFTSQVWRNLELSFWFPPLVAYRKTHQCTHLGMETHLHQRRRAIRTCQLTRVGICCDNIMLISLLCYQVRRFPRAARQKTKHHSAWCTRGQKWFQEPSTWEEDEPAMIERKCSSVSWSIAGVIKVWGAARACQGRRGVGLGDMTMSIDSLSV